MASNKDKKLGWHFLPEDLVLSMGDGRKAKVGGTLKMKGSMSPSCCQNGMHASEKVSQAASFERGPVLTRVEVWGDLDEDTDKFCGRYRKVLWMRKVEEDDLRVIARSMGMPNVIPPSICGVTHWLKDLVRRDEDSFDRAAEAWAKKHGAKDSVAPTTRKPLLEEKHLIKIMIPRVVQTKAEILRHIGSYYDLESKDDGYDDRLEEIVANCDRILLVDNIDGRGNDGWVLQSARR